MANRFFFALILTFGLIASAFSDDCANVVCAGLAETTDSYKACCVGKDPNFGAKNDLKSCTVKRANLKKTLPGDPIVIETKNTDGTGDAG